jgi:quinol monooxygenase YgiN
MSDVIGIARLTIHEGKLEEFKHISARAKEIVRERDIGTLQYDVFLDAAGRHALVFERYRDEAALIQHVQNMTETGIMEGVMALCTAEGEILGDVSGALARQLDGGPVRLLSLWQSL